MKIASILCASVVLVSTLGACAPARMTRTLDSRPGLAFAGAPAGAVVVVDNVDYGDASRYDGKHTALRLESGTHDIQVVHAGQTLLAEKVFLGGGEIRTIPVIGAK